MEAIITILAIIVVLLILIANTLWDILQELKKKENIRT